MPPQDFFEPLEACLPRALPGELYPGTHPLRSLALVQATEDPDEFFRPVTEVDVSNEPFQIRQGRCDYRFTRREGFVSLRWKGSSSEGGNTIGDNEGVGLAQVFGQGLVRNLSEVLYARKPGEGRPRERP